MPRDVTAPVPGCFATAIVAFVSTVLGAIVVAAALAVFRSTLCLGAQQIAFVAYGVPAISSVIFAGLLVRATRKVMPSLFRGLTLLAVLFLLFGLNLNATRQSLDAARQAATVRSMRKTAALMETYRQRHRGYPPVDDIETLSRIIDVDRHDGWGNEFRVWSSGEGYRLVSCGACGDLEAARGVALDSRSIAHPRDDLVIDNGRFVRWID